MAACMMKLRCALGAERAGNISGEAKSRKDVRSWLALANIATFHDEKRRETIGKGPAGS